MMGGPWEKYAPTTAPVGPWEKYRAPARDVASERIAGAFEAAQPVRQVDKLVEPNRGLLTSRNRFGDVSFIPPALQDLWGATETVGGVLRGDIPAMVPDTGQGVTNPQVESAAKTIGAAALPINPAVRAGDLAIPGIARSAFRKPKVPTQEQLYKTGGGQFNEAFGMGVDYDPNAIANFASQGRAHLDAQHFNAENAPNTFSILKSLENPQGQFVPLSGFEHARRRLFDGATSKTDAKAGRIIADAISRVTENPPAGVLSQGSMAGPAGIERAAAAGDILKRARGNWAAMERSKELAGRAKSAERRAKASNSGLNIDNTLRQRVASLLDQIDKGQIKGFSAEEKRAMNEFAEGRAGRNSVRFLANWFGGGGGLGTFASTTAGVGGLLAGHPAFLALPATGLGLKLTQNALGKSAMRKLDETVRQRSPLYSQTAPGPPLSAEARAAALRALTMSDASNAALGPQSPLRIYLNADERDRYLGGPLVRR